MVERRRLPRVPSWLSAQYALAGSDAPQATIVRDVSSGGCAFFTASLLPAGTVVEVTVEAPERRRAVAFTARVAWSGKLLLTRREAHPWAFEAGVRFVKIAPEELARLLGAASGDPPA